LDKPTRAVEYFFVTTIRIELEAQVIVGGCFECKAILERGLDLNIPTIRCVAIVIWLRNLVKDYVVLKFSNDFSDIADQATIDREPPVRECGLEALDALKNKGKTFGNGYAFGHDQRGANVIWGEAVR